MGAYEENPATHQMVPKVPREQECHGRREMKDDYTEGEFHAERSKTSGFSACIEEFCIGKHAPPAGSNEILTGKDLHHEHGPRLAIAALPSKP